MKKTTLNGLKAVLVILLFLISPSVSFSQVQGVVKCYTDEMDAQMHADHPGAESKADFEDWVQQAIEAAKTNKIVGGVYQIPVVVHVIHSGEAIGSGTNVSQAAIQSQIDVLNEDFRKMLGTNGYNTNPVGADTQIEFCLAQRRPDGSAFAAGQPGVNRILYSSITSTAPPYSTNFIDATIKTWTYNGGVATATRGWVPTKYMNIWLCNISGGILGYAQFPTSPLGGMFNCASGGSNATDGVVFLYNSIGKSSVTGFTGAYNEGRTATHEIGHWLGLRHIWGDGNCSVDDYCNDTPLAAAANFGCPTINSCTNSPDPGNDMVANYMDYTDDLCMNIFTNDQKQRMRAVLEGSPNRVSLINSDACIPPNTNDASITDVLSPKGDNCPGSLTPSVQLRNRGSATLTSATISYNIDGGAVTSFSWTGSLTAGSSATVSLPAFTATLGTHTIKSWNSLPNGTADPSATYDTSSISFMVSNGIMPNYTQNFEGQTFPPDLRWVVENVNGDCTQWTVASGTSAAGTFINNMAMLPFFQDASTTNENLYTPIFILPCNATAASLTFNVAYRQKASTTNDRLIVEISQDCGVTWTATTYDKQGSVLAVSSTLTGNAEYYPTAASHWRAETINLLSYVSSTSKNVRFRFRGIANNGNNIFVDDVKFLATTPGEIQVMQSTTEVLDGGYYNFPNTNTGSSSTQTFTINNTGTTSLVITPPLTVTGTGFTVGTTFGTTTIPAGGSTTFTLTFTPTGAGAFTGNVTFNTNDCDESTYNFTLNGTGIIAPTASFTATPNPACVGQTVTYTSTSTLATSYSWNFGTGATPATATTAGPHTVTYSSAGSKTVTLQINGSGPTSTQTVVVNANPATPTISAGGPTTFCSGGSVTLTAPASTSYLWSNGATTQSITVTTAGSYTVQVFNASGCSATSAAKVVTVTALPATPTITAGGPTTFCAGGSVVLTSSSATGNTWSTGATTQSITVTTSGTYTVTKTSGGCTSAASAGTTVTVNPIPSTPTITAGGPATFCAGGSVVLTSSSATGNTWSNGATTQSITVTTGGTYTVTVTSSGCSSAASTGTTVTVNPLPATPTITAGGPTTFCAGGSVVLTSSSATGNTWSTGATTQSITVTTSGTYTVTKTSGGCTSAASAGTTVTVNPIPLTPTITAGGPTTFCAGGSVVLTSSSATGNTWSTGATTQSITVTTGGTYTVTVTSSGCSSAASTGTTVTVNPLPATPTITAGGPTTFCAGGSVVLTSSSATGNTWSNGATTQSITVTTGGTYTVTVTSSGCSSAASAGTTVTVNPIPSTPTITAGGSTTFCAGGSVVLTSSSATGNTWSNGATTQSITVTTGGTYTVTVTSSGCSSAASAGTTVTVNPIPSTPTITAGGPTTFCAGGSVVLTSSSASGNTWSNGATTQSITATSGGTYTVTVTSSGCSSAASAGTTITVNPVPVISLGTITDPTLCSGTNGSIQVNGSGSGNITWSGASSGSMNGVALPQTISGLGAGSYTISFVSSAGCSSNTLNQSLVGPSSPAAPVITASGPTTFCPGGSVTLTSGAGSTYLWSTGETTSSIVVSTAASITVQITNASGCTSPMSAPTVVTINSVPATPVITPGGPTAFCAGQTVTLTSSGTNSTWSTSETTNSIVVSATGSYTVTETNGSGCTATSAPVTVTVNPIPAMPTITAAGPTTFCQEGSVTLTSSSSTGNTWSTSETTPSISVSTSGTVTLTVTSNGCTSAPASQSITVNNDPVVSMGMLNGVCTYTAPFALTVGSPSGGIYSGNGVSGGTFNPGVAGLGTTTITYTYADGNGCSGSATTTIIVDGCAGLSENATSMSLYPNPTNGILHIESTASIENVMVYDKLGKLVFREIAFGKQSVDIDLSGVATGVYTIHVTTNDTTTIENVVIQK